MPYNCWGINEFNALMLIPDNNDNNNNEMDSDNFLTYKPELYNIF